MSATTFLTIAGRWKQHFEASGLDKALPRREQALAMLMFYAGFGAALDATLEIADLSDQEAVHLLTALHSEIKQLEAMAGRILGGGGVQ